MAGTPGWLRGGGAVVAEMLTVPEVAAELRIDSSSVYRLIRSGALRAVNVGTRRKVVSREALDDFVRSGGVHGDREAVEAPSEPVAIRRPTSTASRNRRPAS